MVGRLVSFSGKIIGHSVPTGVCCQLGFPFWCVVFAFSSVRQMLEVACFHSRFLILNFFEG